MFSRSNRCVFLANGKSDVNGGSTLNVLHGIRWTMIIFLAAVVVAYAIAVCIYPELSSIVKTDLQNPNFNYTPWIYVLYVHIVTAVLAISIGPIQFLLRRKRRSRHRFLGMVYVLAVFVSGFVSFYLSLFSNGGLLAHIGFLVLDICWDTASWIAYKKARSGHYTASYWRTAMPSRLRQSHCVCTLKV
jgi:uncharacterized membrane protein